jgi:hypothetical protein
VERATERDADALRLSAPVFSADALDSLARALTAVKLSHPEKPPPPPPSREDLVAPLMRALAEKNPLRLDATASAKASTLVLVASGRARDAAAAEDEADALLREHALPPLCGEATRPAVLPGDNVRLVLDLRALAFFPRAAAIATMQRWGAFAACRCFEGRIAVVMPHSDECAAELRAAVAEARAADAFAQLRCAVFVRSRDVAQFMNSNDN